jgi:hypothetical protein
MPGSPKEKMVTKKSRSPGGGIYTKARDERRRAERDEQLLANRIALLKQEEAKAWKKIQQTKVRAEQVLQLREENRKRGNEAKRIIKQQKREEKKRLLDKMQNRDAVSKANADREYRVKRESVAQMKRDKANVQREKTEVYQEMISVAKSRVNKIKQQKQKALAKRKDREQAIIERNKRIHDEKIQKEERALRKREAEVRKMEKRERELIERLKRTQELQREAYEQLETALGQE